LSVFDTTRFITKWPGFGALTLGLISSQDKSELAEDFAIKLG